MRTSTWIWLIIIVVIIAGGAWWYTNRDAGVDQGANSPVVTENDTTNETGGNTGGAGEVVVVNWDGEGYEPKEITIRRGDTVRFVNTSTDGETWPASAVHPTHSVYPVKNESDCLGSSFDACKRLQPGESWEFTFTEVGEWRYHDHTHASQTGTVTVTE